MNCLDAAKDRLRGFTRELLMADSLDQGLESGLGAVGLQATRANGGHDLSESRIRFRKVFKGFLVHEERP